MWLGGRSSPKFLSLHEYGQRPLELDRTSLPARRSAHLAGATRKSRADCTETGAPYRGYGWVAGTALFAIASRVSSTREFTSSFA
jgi:hypothetical protein